jgi:uncharacterized membrane protein
VPLDAQFWLNKLGIGVFLLGVALLFRYSIDQGWITPARRVAFGALLGGVLFVAGLRMDDTRRRFVPVLLGGGIAVFYIVGFAAYNLYALLGYEVAFAGMVAVTVLAYAMALRKGQPVLAILGALGGLGTPLILGIDRGSPTAFALYTSLILAWTSALYLMRGWKPVLWTSLVGGWLLLLLYAMPGGLDGAGTPASERWTLQAAAAFAWVACGVLPFVRELRLKARVAADGAAETGERWTEPVVMHWHGLALLPPLLGLLVTAAVWHPTARVWGVLAVGVAALYAGASVLLSRRDEHLPRILALSASVFLAAGTVSALSGDALVLALAVEGLVLLYLARRYYGPAIAMVGHLLYAAAAVMTAVRLAVEAGEGIRYLGTDLGVIAAGLAISYVLAVRQERRMYRCWAHLAFLAWLWRALPALAGYEAAATVAWAAYGAVLLALARRTGDARLERAAASVLPLVVARAFLVDLAPYWHVEATLLCIAAEALVFLFLAKRYASAALRATAHLLAGVAGLWTVARLVAGGALGPRHGMVDLAVLAVLLLLSWMLVRREEKLAYRFVVHGAFLGLLWRDLSVLPGGQGYATAAWAAYAVVLLVVAMRQGWTLLERAATWTLILVVAKLFLVDLARLEAIWRILLFLGIGGGFLFLSYALQSWRRAVGPEPGEVSEPRG